MKTTTASLGLLLALLFPMLAGSEEPGIRLKDRETVVFLGDSITEQNRWTSLVEAYLVSRFPGKAVSCWNLGWSGDTARGGSARLGRDVPPGVKPTLLVVAYGMNDGYYMEYGEWMLDTYLPYLRNIIAGFNNKGSRVVLVPPTAIDWHPDAGWYSDYNLTLEKLGEAVAALGRETKVQVVDVFHPMLKVVEGMRAAKAADSLTPDSIHPSEPGGLVVAYGFLGRVDAPKVLGEILVAGQAVSCQGEAKVSGAAGTPSGVAFTVNIPFIPFWVPSEARSALNLVPFQRELNRFTLQMEGGPVSGSRWIGVDGKLVAVVPGTVLAGGVDLALLDSTPWAQRGRRLWEAAQFRNARFFDGWRRARLEAPAQFAMERALRAPLNKLYLDLVDFTREEGIRMREIVRGPFRHRLEVSSTPWYSAENGPRLIEGWEEGTGGWIPWDEGVVLSAVGCETPAGSGPKATQGCRMARLDYDLSLYEYPELLGDLPVRADFSGVRRIAVDVFVKAGSGGRSARVKPVVLRLVLSGGKKKSAEMESAVITPGKWVTLRFDLSATVWTVGKDAYGPVPAGLAAATNGFGLMLVGQPGSGAAKGSAWFDNLRTEP